MTELVPTDQIVAIVGVERHATKHIARAVSAEQRVYILHPFACLESTEDLRDCPFSARLELYGIDPADWVEDVPVVVRLSDFGALVPAGEVDR